MISKFVIPTDGSTLAENAAQYGIGLASQCGASIVFVSVVDVGSPEFALAEESSAPGPGIDPRLTAKDFQERAREAVDRMKKCAAEAKVKAEGVVRVGRVAKEIIAQAAESNADMIVMGSHGRSGLGAAVIGSVSTDVIRESTLPVLIVRGK